MGNLGCHSPFQPVWSVDIPHGSGLKQKDELRRDFRVCREYTTNWCFHSLGSTQTLLPSLFSIINGAQLPVKDSIRLSKLIKWVHLAKSHVIWPLHIRIIAVIELYGETKTKNMFGFLVKLHPLVSLLAVRITVGRTDKSRTQEKGNFLSSPKFLLWEWRWL